MVASVSPLRSSQTQPFPFPDKSKSLPTPFLAILPGLVEKADQIVRGQVTDVHSAWSQDRSIIESAATIRVNYSLLGHASPTITVRTPGGYLPQEGVGMVSMHAATYAVGEEVLIFIHQQGAEWRMVDGAMGKFLVEGKQVFNHDLALTHSIQALLPAVVTLVKKRGLQSQLPIAWRYLQPTEQTTPVQWVKAQSAVQKWTTPHASAA